MGQDEAARWQSRAANAARGQSRATGAARWQSRAVFGAKTAQLCHLARISARDCHLGRVSARDCPLAPLRSRLPSPTAARPSEARPDPPPEPPVTRITHRRGHEDPVFAPSAPDWKPPLPSAKVALALIGGQVPLC